MHCFELQWRGTDRQPTWGAAAPAAFVAAGAAFVRKFLARFNNACRIVDSTWLSVCPTPLQFKTVHLMTHTVERGHDILTVTIDNNSKP